MPKVIVRALPRQGFFRAGRYWPHESTEVDVDDQVLAVLQAEPRLIIELADGPKAKEPPPPSSKGKPKGKGKEPPTPDGDGGGEPPATGE